MAALFRASAAFNGELPAATKQARKEDVIKNLEGLKAEKPEEHTGQQVLADYRLNY